MKHNSRKYSRRMSYLKALRKQRIDRERSGQRWPLYYNNLHQYSKNKIHCSCWMCRYGGWNLQDAKIKDSMDAAEKDYLIDFF